MSNLSGFVKRIRDIMRNDAGINGDAQRIEQIAWMLFLKVYDTKEQDWEFNDDDYESIIPENCRWADAKTQCRNRSTNIRIKIGNASKTLMEWCEIFELDYSTIHARYERNGYTGIDDLFNPPIPR